MSACSGKGDFNKWYSNLVGDPFESGPTHFEWRIHNTHKAFEECPSSVLWSRRALTPKESAHEWSVTGARLCQIFILIFFFFFLKEGRQVWVRCAKKGFQGLF